MTAQVSQGSSAAAIAAAALPGVGSLEFLSSADPAVLSPADLIDALITAERLLAHINALQVRLLAELGRPHRCGDVTRLVAALVDQAGACRGPDGCVDDELVAELTAQRSIGVAATEVAAVLDWAPVTAKIRITQSQRLQTALPKTLAALAAGRVDVGRVRMITDRTAVLSPQLCQVVERRILKWVKGRSKARLETLVDREVILADPDAAENRRLAAIRDRSVTHRPDKDGMGVINALLPAQAAVMVFTVIDLIAQANKGLDSRTVDQRRADAITDIADELLTFGFVDLHGLIARVDPAAGDHSTAGETGESDTSGVELELSTHRARPVTYSTSATAVVEEAGRAARLARAMSRHGRRPHLNVTGAWTTITGLDDLPGHLDGHGVITAQLLRAISKSWGTVTAVGINPVTGTATTIGALTYRPSQGLSDQVMLLSGTCRMAGCAMPAWRCDIDHLDRFDHNDPAGGGKTSLCNTAPFCKFHHLLKHHTDWTPYLQPDLSIVWTTNTGHEVTSHPREFTLPGEWLRPPPPAAPAPAPETTPAPVPETTLASDIPDAGDNSAPDTTATNPDPEVLVGLEVLVGPTVAGPTIPVIPAGTNWIEPHTELEDPDTIPDPGSIEIRTYRALRQQAWEHSRQRLAALRQHLDPAEQRKRDFIDGKQYDAAGNLFNPADFDTATCEKARMTEALKIAALVKRPQRPTRPRELPLAERSATERSPAEPSHDRSDPDEAPF